MMTIQEIIDYLDYQINKLNDAQYLEWTERDEGALEAYEDVRKKLIEAVRAK